MEGRGREEEKPYPPNGGKVCLSPLGIRKAHVGYSPWASAQHLTWVFIQRGEEEPSKTQAEQHPSLAYGGALSYRDSLEIHLGLIAAPAHSLFPDSEILLGIMGEGGMQWKARNDRACPGPSLSSRNVWPST